MIEKANLVKIVGRENVDTSQSTLDKYSSDISFVEPIRPYCVVKVKNLSEVQSIVKLAVQTQTPLIPVSSGFPHFRGDTVPGTGGAIIIDLSPMKRVIHIDRKNRSVMFEPGVTFAELISAVVEEGLRLNLPLLPRQSKSVIGSLLEREPVIMPKYHWDISDPLGCTEIVFGTGDLFRTGAAAGSGTIEEQWAAGGGQKEAAGPSSSSWYRLIQGSQGTMGIVTWATARCELIPKLEEPFLIGSSDLNKIMDVASRLIYMRLVNECLVLNKTNLASILAGTREDYQEIKNSLPPWILFYNLVAYEYFPEERISGQIKDMLEITQRYSVEAVKVLGNVRASTLLKVVQRSSDEPYWKLRHYGSCQDIFFLTINDKINLLIKTMQEAADSIGFCSSDLGIYLQPIVQGVNCHCEFNLFYNPDNAAETTRVKQLNSIATRNLLSAGAFFSRPYGENTGLIMNRDAATLNALKKVKAIADPAGIMNPGKLCF
jgi:FAD/FMN-containing dehydrogenase